MKKSIIKSIALGIGGLLSLSFLFGTGLSNQFINKKENNNINQFNIRKYINTEGTKLPSNGGSLASGTYYLDSDMTLTNYISCATGKNIIINLNGFSLSAKPNSNQTIVYVKGGTLTINGKDDVSGTMGTLCNGTGYYDGSYTRGGAIAMYADGTNVSNVTINDCNIGNNTAAFAGAIFISKGSTATLNNCNVYNNDSTSDPSYGYRGAIYVEDASSTVNINGGEIYNNEGGVLLWGNNSQSSSANLNGVYVHDNAKFGVRLHGSANGNAPLTIAGDTIIKNNPSASSTEQANLRLNGSNRGKFTFPSGLGDNAYIGITMQGTYGVFTSGWSQYMGDADFNDYFFSDSTTVIIGKNPSGELLLGAPRTVTYNTEHGTAPDPDTVADGSIILNEPTSPSEAGYEFQGWYKDSGFETAWNFATDTVTADTTLYAKWEEGVDPAVANVIQLINDIGDLTYDGGANDSLDDIVAAKTAYDALTPAQKEIVNGVNKDVLDHDILTYQHVDNVGDLIKEIPEPSDSQEYYDAVDAAYAAYYALTDEEEAILNADLNFEYKKTLDDHVEAKEVIEIIKGIGEVTYNGGQDDSKDDIVTAQQAYDNLTNEQKELVNQANKDDLDDAKETYDNVDDAVHAIEAIGNINHGGENDSKDKINTARTAYDQLTNEQKDLVNNYQETYNDLHDAEKVYTVLEKIDDIGEGDDDEKIKTARDAYETLTTEQKELVKDEYVQKLNLAEKRSEDTNKQANILFIIFLILFIILIVSGLIVLYLLLKRRNEENDNNNKQVKLASVSGLLPFAIFASYFTSTNFIILYVLAAIAILIWLTNLILFVSNKRQKEVKVEAKCEAVAINKPQVSQTELVNEDDEVETIKDEKGNIFQIRFIKSFTAKLIQSPGETKKYYEELKNEVLSYKKTNSRISWHYDAVNVGRNYVLKFAVRGKTLCVYLPLNADDYTNSKYKVEKVESKKYEDVPCLYRIKNDRRLGYAKELIALVAANYGLEKGGEHNEVYSDLPYEPNKPLVERGLIKELKSKVQDQKVIEKYESISASKADEVMSDEKAEASIEEIMVNKHDEGRKEIINIDTLSEHYNNGDEVTLESLIEKKLVSSKTGHIKVLARGVLDKTLHVVANEYSLQAVKMIILVGGSVKKVK